MVWLGLEHLSCSFLPAVVQYFHACWVVGWRASQAGLGNLGSLLVVFKGSSLCLEWSLVNKTGVSEIAEVCKRLLKRALFAGFYTGNFLYYPLRDTVKSR